MRKITAVALCATTAAGVWAFGRMTDEKPPAKAVEKIERSWSIPAEDSAIYQNAKISMREWCDEEGLRSEVWIERNKVGRLEVLGRCKKS